MKRISPSIADYLLTFMLCVSTMAPWAHAELDMDPFEGAETCGHDHATETLLAQQPELAQAYEENIEAPYVSHMNLMQFALQPELNEEEVYTLPVVVHILLPEGNLYNNLTDEEVQTTIAFLNEQFANIPTSSLPPGQGFYRPDGTNTKIQFALALQDPNGNPTTGINRYEVGFDEIPTTSPNAATNIAAWPAEDYINFWAVADIEGSVVGFAYLPNGSSTPDHRGGIFFKAQYLNTNSTNFDGTERQYTSRLRTITHELGHYLGLRHTFQSNGTLSGCTVESGQPPWACATQPNYNCLLNGDRVCDTPPDGWGSPSNGTTCLGATPQNSSHTDADDTSSNNPFTEDVNDIQANVMDYSGSSCIQHISQNQKERMRAIILASRSSLLVSPALQAPDVANCTYKAPILTFLPDEVKADSVTESGTIVASIKNNNVGSSCPDNTFTLTQTISDDNVDTNMVSNSVSLSAQETKTISINYTLDMVENAIATLQFEAKQTGQPNKKATRGILVQTNELNNAVNGIVKAPGAAKALNDANTTTSASVMDSFSGGGCASQNAGFMFLMLLGMGLLAQVRTKKSLM